MFFASYSAFFLFLLLHKNVTCKKQGIQVRVLFYSPFLVLWLFLLAYFAFSICASCVFVIDGIAVKQVLQQPDRKKKNCTALHIALHFMSSQHNLARQLNSSTLYCPTLQNCLKAFETSCGVAIAVCNWSNMLFHLYHSSFVIGLALVFHVCPSTLGKCIVVVVVAQINEGFALSDCRYVVLIDTRSICGNFMTNCPFNEY